MTNRCRFCGGKLVSYEQRRFWYSCSECRASGPLMTHQKEALAAMTGDGNENQLIETNCALSCRVVALKKEVTQKDNRIEWLVHCDVKNDQWKEQLEKEAVEKDRRIEKLIKDTIKKDECIESLTDTIRILRTRYTPKKAWPEGVVADEYREAKYHEAGHYRYWHKDLSDNSPHFTTISAGSMFNSDFIYKKRTMEEMLLSKKPVKQ